MTPFTRQFIKYTSSVSFSFNSAPLKKNQCGNLTCDFEKKPIIFFKVENRMQSYFYYYPSTFDPKTQHKLSFSLATTWESWR